MAAIQCIQAWGHEITISFFYQEQECGEKKKKSGMVECVIFYQTTISGVYPLHIWVQMSNILTRFKINLFRNSRASSFAVSACRSAFGFKIKWKKKKKRKNFWLELFKMESESASHFFLPKISLSWGFDLGFCVLRKHSWSFCLNMYTCTQIFWKNKIILLYSSNPVVTKIT